MQDPSAYSSAALAGGGGMNIKQPAFPEQEQLKCPRCDSPNTKFCYYNNYNLSQPRHFCKNCKRYWTKGGALRNIPVGGGSRKNTKKSSSSVSAKRSSSSSSSALSASSATSSNTALLNSHGVQNIAGPKAEPGPIQMWMNQGSRGGVMDMNANANANVNADVSGGFSSLLASNGQFGSLFESMGNNGAGAALRALEFGEFGENLNLNSGTETGRASGLELQNGDVPADGFLALQNGDSTCWNGSGNGWPDLAIYTPGSTYQ